MIYCAAVDFFFSFSLSIFARKISENGKKLQQKGIKSHQNGIKFHCTPAKMAVPKLPYIHPDPPHHGPT